jgi:hypothetical protein
MGASLGSSSARLVIFTCCKVTLYRLLFLIFIPFTSHVGHVGRGIIPTLCANFNGGNLSLPEIKMIFKILIRPIFSGPECPIPVFHRPPRAYDPARPIINLLLVRWRGGAFDNVLPGAISNLLEFISGAFLRTSSSSSYSCRFCCSYTGIISLPVYR